jgi:transposase
VRTRRISDRGGCRHSRRPSHDRLSLGHYLPRARNRWPLGTSPGRPPKLTSTQEKIVLRWLSDDPTEHGFPTSLWTADRLGQRIERELNVTFNPRYLSSWLRDRGFTPQKPQRVPRKRDPEEIQQWLATDWPRIKKKPGGRKPTSP